MRYDRVQRVLESDLALRTRIGPRDVEVCKRNGEASKFSRGVVAVTDAIHNDGKDAHTIPPHDVLTYAIRVLEFLNTAKAGPPPGPPPPPKKPKSAVAVKPVIKAKAPERPAPKKVAAPAPPSPSSPPAKAVAQVPVKLPVAVAVKTGSSPLKSVVAAVPSKPVSAKKVTRPGLAPGTPPVPKPVAPLSPSVPTVKIFQAVIANMAAVHNVLHDFDRTPGAETRLSKVEALLAEFVNLKDVAVPMPLDKLQEHTDAKTTSFVKA